jgi:hypothetical protein
MTAKPREVLPGTQFPTPLADRLAQLDDVVDFARYRRIALAERAMAGDLEAAITWLRQHADSATN